MYHCGECTNVLLVQSVLVRQIKHASPETGYNVMSSESNGQLQSEVNNVFLLRDSTVNSWIEKKKKSKIKLLKFLTL